MKSHHPSDGAAAPHSSEAAPSHSRAARFTSLFISLIVLGGSLALWVYMSLRTPFNDDEWIHFQPIACHLFPNGMLHRQPFREWCGAMDLFVFGARLPIRAYSYIGVSQALVFLPFWEIVQSPMALRICTGTLWLLNSLLLARLLVAPWALVMCVAMLSTPLFSQHLIDTGPFAFQLTMLLLAITGLLNALASESRARLVAFSVIATIPAFLAFEQKATVVFAIPAAVLLVLSGYVRREIGRTWSWKTVLIRCYSVGIFHLGVLIPLLWWYINLKMINGDPYWGQLLANNDSYSLSRLDDWKYHARELFETFVIYPSTFFHRTFGVTRIELPVFVTYMEIIFGVVALLLVALRKWRYLGLLILSLVLTAVSFALVSRSVRSWAGHHMVYSLMIPFLGLTVSLAALLPRLWWCVVPIVSALLYVQVPTFVQLTSGKALDHSDGAKEEILAIVNEPSFAASHVVVHLSWGAFFQDALFGPPSQVVVWSDFPKAAEIDALAAETQRKVAYIRLQSDPRSASTPQERGWKLLAVSSSGGWELWERAEG